MTYTTHSLISSAYFASGIVAREFETVSGTQIADGLIALNEILSEKVVDSDLIPYEGTQTFVGVAGQEEYTVDDLIHVDTLTFVKESVRYSMMFQPRNAYHGGPRVNSISSLPYKYFWEKQLGGSKIFLYFTPNEAYTFTIYGIFRLSSVALGQDLELTLEKFYISYLRYALAERLCVEYDLPVPVGVQKQLATIQLSISKNSRVLDLSVSKLSTLGSQKGIGWAYVNLGNGYLP